MTLFILIGACIAGLYFMWIRLIWDAVKKNPLAFSPGFGLDGFSFDENGDPIGVEQDLYEAVEA
jgi:hypothetical protein